VVFALFEGLQGAFIVAAHYALPPERRCCGAQVCVGRSDVEPAACCEATDGPQHCAAGRARLLRPARWCCTARCKCSHSFAEAKVTTATTASHGTKLCRQEVYLCCVCGVHASKHHIWDDSHWWAMSKP
jgi:hypothetical protein